ncbi:MAG: class I SAM-dependent methyltransferase [Bacteroidota bacterium]
MKKPKYIHLETSHNLKSPRGIVPQVMKLFAPASVVDVGCGIGTFLFAFKEAGVKDVLGIDGHWVNRDLLKKYLHDNEFMEWDLEKPIKMDKRFDLVISLEVAEHLSPDSADSFVKNLVELGDIVLFGAAVPSQGGTNHLNEQWLTYWEKKFLEHEYLLYDALRPLIWNDKDVFWWYKQNSVIFASKNLNLNIETKINPPTMRNIVHYDFLLEKSIAYDKLIRGNESPLTYIKCLIKSIFNLGSRYDDKYSNTTT